MRISPVLVFGPPITYKRFALVSQINLLRPSPFTHEQYQALLCIRTKDGNEAETALIALMITNVAYSTATLALGFGPKPSLTLYE